MSTAAPAVSIAIRAFRRRWLGEAIASALNQTYRDLELVVYDDAGDLEELVADFTDPRVRYHRAASKLGPSGRFSAAAGLCRGRYIGVLDDDDRYQQTFVAELVAELERDPGAGIASCKVTYDVGGKLYVPPDPRAPGRQGDALREILAFRTFAPPSVMIFRAEALAAVESAHPMPDGVNPDGYLNIQAAAAGWGHVLVGEQLAIRRLHDGQVSETGLDALELTVSTWQRLSVGGGELDELRRAVLARKLIWRAIHRLAGGERGVAREDLAASSSADPARWRALRGAVAAAAAVPLAGPLLARGVLRVVRDRARRSPPASLSGAGGASSALSPLRSPNRPPPATPNS